MSPEKQLSLIWVGILIVAFTMIGMTLIVALLAAWRRYHARQRLLDAKQQQSPKPPPDIWREAAERFPGEPDPPEDQSSPDSDSPRKPDDDSSFFPFADEDKDERPEADNDDEAENPFGRG